MAQKPILIVEDDTDIREMLQSLLQEEGYPVAVAGNGQQALDLLLSRSHTPALIFLDLMMPVLDGHGLMAALKAQPGLKDIPVVILTAATTEPIKEAAGFIKKPLDISQLLAAAARFAKD